MHLNGELRGALAGRDALYKSTHIFNSNGSFDFFFVDVVDVFVGDNQRALLGPIVHVGFFHLVCEKQALRSEELH